MNAKILPSIIRLNQIVGYDGKTNDLIFCRPSIVVEKPGLCVYFGGDIQDFTENMLSHRDNKNHVQWNLDNTAKLLQSSFVDSYIIVIRPARMEYKTFSCFDNFLPCSKCGVPDHTPTYHGLKHLESIIQNVSITLRTMNDEEFNEAVEVSKNGLVPRGLEENVKTPENVPLRSSLDLNNCDITLIGFSKGCVVLNQFLYEFHNYKLNNIESSGILKKIKSMYWLDGGHSGGKNTWITSLPLLETLASLGIEIFIHVSPYQIADERRPWIKTEEKNFTETLKKLGAVVHRTVHFDNVPSSLQTHFNVLKIFKESRRNS